MKLKCILYFSVYFKQQFVKICDEFIYDKKGNFCFDYKLMNLFI